MREFVINEIHVIRKDTLIITIICEGLPELVLSVHMSAAAGWEVVGMSGGRLGMVD